MTRPVFRIYDHRDRRPASEEMASFDRVVTQARDLARREPGRFLEVQRLEPNDHETWVPTGWTFGVQGDWD